MRFNILGAAALACLFSQAAAQATSTCGTLQAPTNTGCGPTPTPKVTKITGPLLLDNEFSDPSIHFGPNNTYWVYATNQVGKLKYSNGTGCGPNLPYANTTNLFNPNVWVRNTYNPRRVTSCATFNDTIYDAMPRKNSTDNGVGIWTDPDEPDLWNPDLIRLNTTFQNGTTDRRYLMYYSAVANSTYTWFGQDVSGTRCIGVGHSDVPQGPFTPMDAPIFCSTGGAIGLDSVTANGKRWLLFKSPSCPPGTPKSCVSYLNIIQLSLQTGLPVDANPTPDPVTSSTVHGQGEEGPATAQMCNGKWLLLHTNGEYKYTYTIQYAISRNCYINSDYDDYPNATTSALIKDQLYYNNLTLQNQMLYTPGSPDWLKASNDVFFFSARQNAYNTSIDDIRKLYIGEMGYCNGTTSCNGLPNPTDNSTSTR